jgi:polysaccharide export outer membrane protein
MIDSIGLADRDSKIRVLAATVAVDPPQRMRRRLSAGAAMTGGPYLILALVLSLLLPAGARAQEASGDYRIGPKDLLVISVLEITELNVERRVEDSGAIDLPLLGQFKVAGLTALEARAQLEDLLRAKYVNRANVSVVVKEFANKPISVVGAVTKPGSLSISGRFTLLQAISAAGGLDQTAGKKIYVLRRAENGLSDNLEIKTDDLFRGSTAMWNIPVFPSDVVNIPARTTIKIFCLGEVKTPGALEFDSDDRLSLLSVVAKAGGLTDRASSKVLVKRRGPDGKDVEARYNYKAVISGKEPDPTLKPDDVVVVQESFF